ncbi:MAG: prolyl oligopeptidase family serine peptidase, partial [Actinomycetota bacterium]
MKKFRRTIAFGSAVAALASVSLVGSAASGPVASAEDTWFYDPDRLVFESLPGTDTETLWGDIDGAAWRFEIPADWNGSLLMWAHGYRGEGLELYVDNPPIREHLIDQGYAWAASSYERNGYAVRQGVDNTKELADHVIDELLPAEPDLVLLSGASMGGHITGVAIEEHHQLYDGAMPICGVMGDYELFDYFLDFNVAAQQMALGESQFPVDPTTWFSTTVPEIKAELEGVPGGWPFVLSDTGEKF